MRHRTSFNLTIAAFALVACVGRYDGVQPRPWSTVLVVNEGVYAFSVYGSVGFLARVWPGERKCVRLLSPTPTTLRIRTMNGATYETPRFLPTEFDGGWTMTIGTTPRYDVTSITTASRCRFFQGRR